MDREAGGDGASDRQRARVPIVERVEPQNERMQLTKGSSRVAFAADPQCSADLIWVATEARLGIG